MLNSLRNAAGSWVAKIFIGLLVMSFAVWGVADIFRGFGQSELASVGETVVSPEEFRSEFQRELQNVGRRIGRSLSMEEARAFGLDGQVLGRMLSEATLDQDALEKGLGITDVSVTTSIMQDPAFKDASGNFSRGLFDQTLRQNGFSEQRYAAEQRAVHHRQQIVAALAAGAPVPDILLESAFRFRNEGRSIAYVTVSEKSIEPVGAPSDEQIKEFFETRKDQFRAPEYRKFEQIRFASLDEAKAAREKIAGGTDFMDIAKEKSLTESDVSLGTVAKSGIIDPAIAEAAFALGENEVSQPVEGRLGAALVRVSKIEPGSTKTLDEMRDQLRRELALREAEGKVLDIHDSVEDERAAGSTFEEIAKKLALDYQRFDEVDTAGRGLDGKPVENLPAQANFMPSVFQIEPGVETDALQTPDGGLIWLNVTEIVPDRERTLEEARADVETAWREDEQRRRVSAKAADMVKKLESGATLDEIAKEVSSVLTITPALSRTTQTGQLSPAALEAVFATPEGGFGASQDTDRANRIVYQVRRVTAPEFDPNGDEAKALKASLHQSMANGNLIAYIAAKQNEFGVKVNQTLLSSVLGQ